MGRLLGTDASVPVAASYPPHPITENFNVMTAYPAGALDLAGRGRRQRTHGADARRDQPEQAGVNAFSEALTRRPSPPKTDEDDKKGPVSLAAAVSGPAMTPPLPVPAEKDGRRKTTRSRPKRASSRSATRIS